MIVFNSMLALPLVVVLIVAAVLASILSYLRTTRQVSRAFRGLFILLRLTALAMVFVYIAQPSRKVEETMTEKAGLLMLVDVSKSMEIKDMDNASRADAMRDIFSRNAEQLDMLAESCDLKCLSFGSALRDFSPDFAAEDSTTALGDAIVESIGRIRIGKIAGLVLLSDGANNAGHDPVVAAQTLAEKGIPVFAVGIGKDIPTAAVKDVKMSDIRLPLTTFKRTSAVASATLTSVFCQGQTVRIRLLLDNNQAAEEYVRIASHQMTEEVEFTFLPQQTGPLKVTLAADVLPGEIVTTNNEISSYLHVLPRGINILYLEGRPRYELKFIRRALTETPDIHLDSKIVRNEASAPDEWRRYDVIILGDIRRNAFGMTRLLQIQEMVKKDGVGFIMIGGSHNFHAGGYAASPIENILPIKLAANERVQNEYQMKLTDEGKRHLALRLEQAPDANTHAWSRLPALDGQVPFGETKPGAWVLATGKDASPLLVAQQYGKGRTMAFGADTTWRWAFSPDRAVAAYHGTFWRQMILWLAGGQSVGRERVWIELSAHRVARKEAVEIRTHVEDRDGKDMTGIRTKLSLKKPDGTVEELAAGDLEPQEPAPYRAQAAGDYEVRLVAYDSENREIGADTARFIVYVPDVEFDSPSANLRLLRQLAQVTAGRFCPPSDVSELFEELAASETATLVERSYLKPLWTTSAIVLTFLTAMGLEWFLRRLKGLA